MHDIKQGSDVKQYLGNGVSYSFSYHLSKTSHRYRGGGEYMITATGYTSLTQKETESIVTKARIEAPPPTSSLAANLEIQ